MINQELRDKIEESFTQPFVGYATRFEEDEKSCIYDEAGSILRRVGDNWGETLRKSEYKTVALALVELTREWDADEDSWLEYLSKKLLGSQEEIRGKRYNNICECLNTLKRENSMFMLDCFTKRYYATVCCHAFAPKSSIFSFFDMCWEIYCDDLFQQYAPHDPVVDLITKSLKNKFISNNETDEDISIGSKIYSLRAGIKGLAIDKQDLLSSILDSSLISINSLFNNEPVSDNNYLAVLIKEWWADKESSFGTIKELTKTREREYVANDYSQIKPKYILEHGEAVITIPAFRLLDNYDYEPYIEVFVDGDSKVCEPIPTRGSGIIMTTTAIKYELDSLITSESIDIQIVISHANKTIYNSKNSLSRDFILFGGGRELNSQSLLPGTYHLYSSNIGNLLYPDDIMRITKNLYSISANEGDTIRSLNRVVFFESERSYKDVLFTSTEKRNITYRKEGINYRVIDGDLFLDISDECNSGDIGIRYGTAVFKLSDFSSYRVNDRIRYVISELANPGEPVSISVFRFSSNSILEIANIVKFINISISFDKKIYYGEDDTGRVIFRTENYCLEGDFNINDEEHSIAFNDGEILYSPPVLCWRINDLPWNLKPPKPFFFKELSNSALLEIEAPLNMCCVVGMTNSKLIEQIPGKNIYKIGQTIHSIQSSPLEDITVILRCEDQLFEIAQVFIKQGFYADPIFVRSNEFTLEWNPNLFVGEKDAKLNLQILSPNGIVISSTDLDLNSQVRINCSSFEEGYYDLRIVLAGKGFLLKDTIIFEKRKVLLGDSRSIRFKGKSIMINSAVLFGSIEPVPVKPIYISNIKFLGSKMGYDYYSGSLFIMRNDYKKIYLNHMLNIKTKTQVTVNPVRIELKTLSSCYLGYGLDINDPDFEYDDEFALSYDGRTTVGCSGAGFRNIDYFCFETIEGGV